jgi:rubrerythrin
MSDFIGTEAPLMAEGYAGFPVQTEPSRGPNSGSVEWLLDAVERHANAELESLDQYRYIAETSGDPVIALVMRLILDDEQRHHGLLKRIEASLRDALDWTHSPNALPSTSGTQQRPISKELAETVRALIDEEHTGARYLRDLAKQEQRIDAGLHSLLLELMAMDSEKHARLLQFVRERLTSRARVEDGPAD